MMQNSNEQSIRELLPNWTISGSDLGEFYENLEDLDDRTQYEKVRLSNLSFLSILDQKTLIEHRFNPSSLREGRWPILALSKFNERDKEKIMGLIKDGVVCEGTPEERKALCNEVESVGGLISRCKDQEGKVETTPLSPWAFNDLADRAGVSCANISRKSLARDRWLVEGFTANQVTLVLRSSKSGIQKKIVSIRGKVYEGVRQRPCVQAVQEFLEQELGNAQSKHWDISNEMVNICMEFPEKLKEIREMYPTLPDNVRPIVTIQTSDIGISAFKVSAGFEINGFELTTKAGTVSHIHDTKFETRKLLKDVQNKFYKEFIAIPRELARLLSIEVKNTAAAIEEVLDFIKLDKKDGLKVVAKAIKETMTSEFCFGTYTAYDIVSALLTIQDRLVITRKSDGTVRELPESSMQKLEEALSHSIYCPFETAEEVDYTLLA